MNIAAVLQNYPIMVPKQGQSKPSPTSYVGAQPASADATQKADATASTNQGQYDASVDGLAGLLTVQGQEIMPPNIMLALHAMQGPGASSSGQCSASWTGPAEPAPVTASEVANQMMDSLGSNGVLTLADAENAENGSTSATAATSLDANSDNDIAADFAKLSGGAAAMTVSQLTNAVQKYIDNQSQYPHGFGTRVLSEPV